MPKQWRSDNIYTPVMEANWAKVLGKARVREEGDEAMWSIDLLGDPNDEKIAALQKKIRGLMVEAHGNKPNVSRHGMPLKRHEVKDSGARLRLCHTCKMLTFGAGGKVLLPEASSSGPQFASSF